MADETTTTTTDTSTTTTPAASTSTTSAPAGFSWDAVTLSPESKQLLNDRKWENPDTVIKSYANLEKLARVPEQFLIRLPKDNDQAAWNEVYTKLGRPETADKYAIPVPEGDKGEFAGAAKTWFHEAGISQSQATKLAERWNGYMAEQMKAMETQQTEKNQVEINALKQAWGGEYDQKAAVVDRAAETFGMNQEQLAALKSTLGPKGAMEFLYNIGSKIAVEDNTPIGMGAGSTQSLAMTPEQAQAKLADLRADKSFAQLFNSPDPKARMEAREQVDRLTKLAYPGSTSLPGQSMSARV